MLNVIMLSVKNNPFTLSVFMLNVAVYVLCYVMLNVVMLSVTNNPFALSVFMLSVAVYILLC